MKLLKSIFFSLALVAAGIVVPAYAYGPSGNNDKGVISDVELFYGIANGDAVSQSVTATLGGAATESFGYWLNLNYGYSEGVSTIGGFELAFIWTFFNTDAFSLDLLPAFSFDPNSASKNGKVAYPNFKGFTAGANVEFELTVMEKLTPYMAVGYSASYDNKYSWAIPVTVGLACAVKDGVDMIAVFDWEPGADGAWKSVHKSLGLGVNVADVAGSPIEIDTELGWNFTDKELSVNIGAVLGF